MLPQGAVNTVQHSDEHGSGHVSQVGEEQKLLENEEQHVFITLFSRCLVRDLL